MIFDTLTDWLESTGEVFPTLKEPMKNWFIEQDIHYIIKTEKRMVYLPSIDETISLMFWVIEIKDTDDAMLFKLTWQ